MAKVGKNTDAGALEKAGRGPGRPKKDRPEDPLVLAHVRVREGNSPRSVPVPSHRRNAPAAADMELASIVRRLQILDQRRVQLDGERGDVFREARGRGFDSALIKQMLRDQKIDPLVRQERQEKLDLYRDRLNAAFEAEAAAEAAEEVA